MTWLPTLIPTVGETRPVCIVIGSQEDDFVQKEIVPRLRYLHYRSGESLEMFCVGFYSQTLYAERSGLPVDKWAFDAKAFVAAIEEFELNTEWRYSGATDLLFLTARKTAPDVVALDFSYTMSLNLKRAAKSEAIESVEEFLETLIRIAKEDPPHAVQAASDRLASRWLGKGLKEAILGAVPLKGKEELERSFQFAVKDLAAGEIAELARGDDATLEAIDVLLAENERAAIKKVRMKVRE